MGECKLSIGNSVACKFVENKSIMDAKSFKITAEIHETGIICGLKL